MKSCCFSGDLSPPVLNKFVLNKKSYLLSVMVVSFLVLVLVSLHLQLPFLVLQHKSLIAHQLEPIDRSHVSTRNVQRQEALLVVEYRQHYHLPLYVPSLFKQCKKINF